MSSSGNFHIDNNGNPALCSATVRECPRGGIHGSAEEVMREALRASIEKDEPVGVDQGSWAGGEIEVSVLPDGIKQSANSAVVPAGRYFLGDPCYTAGSDSETWDKWVDAADATSNGFMDGIVGASYNGEPVIGASTKYGDGTYYGSNGEQYMVDAGMIGVVPESVIKGMGLSDEQLRGSGSWVEVGQPTTLEVDDEGNIFFGHVVIETGDRKCENCGQPCAEDDDLCDDCRWEEEQDEYDDEDSDW